MQLRLAAYLQNDSIVDGEGIRTVIWTQGCPHNCPSCHNPGTHDFNGGFLEDIEDIKQDIASLVGQDGITFSGGDPMCQPDACAELAAYAHELGYNVWCYTGYTYEALIMLSKTKKEILDFLNNIDVLVDGKFVLAEKSYDTIFRGSKNQRIIDVKKSLKTGEVVLVKKYDEKVNNEFNFKHEKYLYV